MEAVCKLDLLYQLSLFHLQKELKQELDFSQKLKQTSPF